MKDIFERLPKRSIALNNDGPDHGLPHPFYFTNDRQYGK
jgi:hypothetical protein